MLKNKFKKSVVLPVLAVAVLAGVGTGVLSYANVSKADTTAINSATSTATNGPTTHVPGSAHKGHKHAPLGSDGKITVINGTTLTMTEETNEGGATYTVDASNATFTKAGVASTLSAFKVGDKIFVKGAVTGTNVVATSISSGHGHKHAPLGSDGNITTINGTTLTMTEETNEGGATYTVDASNATFTKAGVASTLSAFKVGDKIFVKGAVTGTNVVATFISSGHGNRHFGN